MHSGAGRAKAKAVVLHVWFTLQTSSEKHLFFEGASYEEWNRGVYFVSLRDEVFCFMELSKKMLSRFLIFRKGD